MGKTYMLVSTHLDWLQNQTTLIAAADDSAIKNWDVFGKNPDVVIIDEAKSIGIDIIRDITATVSRKPYQKAYIFVVIQHAQSMTIQAQQALLKLLEEPPKHAVIFLWVNTKDQLLQTIHSRVFIIEDTQMQDIEVSTARIADFTYFETASIGDKLLKSAEHGKDKETVRQWLLAAQQYYRTKIIEDKTLTSESKKLLVAYIHNIANYMSLLDTGVSPRYIVEMATLQIPKKVRK